LTSALFLDRIVLVSKKALIITDGTISIQSIAQLIAGALSGFKVKICAASEFDGTDLLPAEVFFIGCENSAPPSFSYLEEMLSHINLASRKCGVFSVKEKPLKYLAKIIKDCEADTGEPLLAPDGKINKTSLNKWLKKTLK